MIFRRFLQRFRQQQWGAIATELAIVVIGVVMGLQVDNWNESRREAHRGHEYLVRIESDLAQDIQAMDARRGFWGAAIPRRWLIRSPPHAMRARWSGACAAPINQTPRPRASSPAMPAASAPARPGRPIRNFGSIFDGPAAPQSRPSGQNLCHLRPPDALAAQMGPRLGRGAPLQRTVSSPTLWCGRHNPARPGCFWPVMGPDTTNGHTRFAPPTAQTLAG
jgi:hypothetical protein